MERNHQIQDRRCRRFAKVGMNPITTFHDDQLQKQTIIHPKIALETVPANPATLKSSM